MLSQGKSVTPSIGSFKHALGSRSKHQNIKVVPYYLILQVLKALPNHAFTKTEYILFVTKIKSHQKRSIQKAVDLILAFRELTPEEQKKYIQNIKTKDKNPFAYLILESILLSTIVSILKYFG